MPQPAFAESCAQLWVAYPMAQKEKLLKKINKNIIRVLIGHLPSPAGPLRRKEGSSEGKLGT